MKRGLLFTSVFTFVFFLLFVHKITFNPSERLITFSVSSSLCNYFPKSTPLVSFSKESLILLGTLPPASENKKRETSLKESLTLQKENNESLPPGIKEITIETGGTSLFGVQINNETEYNLENAFSEKKFSPSSPVLIVHTHTSEAYRPTLKNFYEPKDNQRSEDVNFNVAKVGAHLYESLKSKGIDVTHDDTINDYPSYNGSYSKTLRLIEAHLEKNPSINIVLDLHRDAMEKSDGTKLSTVCEINGEKAAQIMIVVGTDQSGLTHSNWRSNFSFAVCLQRALDKKFPGLMRPINVRCERFNGHVSENQLIIEIGTTGNTLEEALLSAEALSIGLSDIIKGS